MRRQPVHTVYGGAQLFRFDTAPKLGELAQRLLHEHAPEAAHLARVLGLSHGLAAHVHARVRAKLAREAVEDFRIDFEDGYGVRSDAEEDQHAAEAAAALARGYTEGTLPPYIGIRIKPLGGELRERALRTLDIVVTQLFEAVPADFADRFFVTLPKLTSAEQPALLAARLADLEQRLGLPARALRFEIMVETPQSLFTHTGAAALPLLLDAGAGRISAAHFGTYDFTAACHITAAHQRMHHPVCDFARSLMQVCLADRVWLSDGSTAVLPVGERAAVHNAWRHHYEDVRRSLMLGFYQGWDLHPGQLVTRYAALYTFFLEAYDAAAARLRNFMANAAQASLLGTAFDDAATGQGLLNYFLRGINSGAFTDDEVSQATGLSQDELRTRSFAGILQARREAAS